MIPGGRKQKSPNRWNLAQLEIRGFAGDQNQRLDTGPKSTKDEHNSSRMKIPLFPLEVVLFPEAALPLHIFEDRYKEMIGECIAGKIAFGVVCAQREGLAVVGCTAEIVRVLQNYPDGRLDILCEGAQRFEIENLDNSRSFLQAEVDFFRDEGLPASRALREECTALHFEVLEFTGGERPHQAFDLDQPVAFRLAWASPADLGFRLELLALRSDAERTERLIAFYSAILPKLRRGAQASTTAGRNGHVM
jgi:Lon protease-like protein